MTERKRECVRGNAFEKELRERGRKTMGARGCTAIENERKD